MALNALKAVSGPQSTGDLFGSKQPLKNRPLKRSKLLSQPTNRTMHWLVKTDHLFHSAIRHQLWLAA